MERKRRPGPSVRVRVREYAAPSADESGERPSPRSREDRLATEEPLEVRASWPGQPAQRVAVTMRTPGNDFELAAGLLYAEGVLDPAALHSVAYCTDEDLAPEEEFNVVTVRLAAAPGRLPSPRPGTVTASSSACGVCGTQSIDDVMSMRGAPARVGEAVAVPPELLHALPGRLREAQRVFESTGGLHAAGWFDAEGRLVVLREDIGRHNAVDKVVGSRLLAGESTAAPVLCVSGRIGFEIVQKAVAAGVGLVAAIGAPSSLAVRLAEEAGLGLVGFLSARRFVVYTAPDRVAG